MRVIYCLNYVLVCGRVLSVVAALCNCFVGVLTGYEGLLCGWLAG